MKRVFLLVTYMYISTFSIDKIPKTVSIFEKSSFQHFLSPVLRKYVVSNFQVVVGKLRLINEGCRGVLQVLHHDIYLVHVFTLSIKKTFNKICFCNRFVCGLELHIRCLPLIYGDVSIKPYGRCTYFLVKEIRWLVHIKEKSIFSCVQSDLKQVVAFIFDILLITLNKILINKVDIL